jgi:hypothetical protein
MKKLLPVLFLIFVQSIFAQTKESWVEKPFSKWPVIALVNEVRYKNGDTYIDPSLKKIGYVGTAFLINTGKDTIAATAKHILWVAKNVNNEGVSINDDLESWVMHQKTNAGVEVVVDKLINEDEQEILDMRKGSILERDWIVFSIRKKTKAIFPLKPRYSPLQPGEKVYRVGNPYASPQTVFYESKVIRTEGNDIYIKTDTAWLKSGGSGSPIIDANGFLVGISSSVFNDAKSGLPVEIAISTHYLKDVLEHKGELNTPKKSIYDEARKIIETRGADQAIHFIKTLRADPENYYFYTLRMAHFDLSALGKKLIAMGKINDAIKILNYNTEMNWGHTPWLELGNAYLLGGNKSKAKEAFEKSLTIQKNKEAEEALIRIGAQ